jgi:hypothetical protein
VLNHSLQQARAQSEPSSRKKEAKVTTKLKNLITRFIVTIKQKQNKDDNEEEKEKQQ